MFRKTQVKHHRLKSMVINPVVTMALWLKSSFVMTSNFEEKG